VPSARVLRGALALSCLSIGLLFWGPALRYRDKYGPPTILVSGKPASATTNSFRDKLADSIANILDSGAHPQAVLALRGLGSETVFWVGLSHADNDGNHFFVNPLGSPGKRLIVRSTDKDRKLARGLTLPIGHGCGLSENSKLKEVGAGDVSAIERCNGQYANSEGITGFVDLVAVPGGDPCWTQASCIQRKTRHTIEQLLERFRDSGQQFDTLIVPAVSTGNGRQGPDFFYAMFANQYTDRTMENSDSIPNIIFAVFEDDWNKNVQTDQGAQGNSLAIQSSLGSCMQKIAIAWEEQADATTATRKARRKFLLTVAGLFWGLAIVPIAFPNFLEPNSPPFGIAALFGYLLLAYAITNSLQDLSDKLTIALTMTEVTLLSIISVPLLYLVHTAEEAARDRFKSVNSRQVASNADTPSSSS
jgi:hypothetical protein